MLRASGVPEHDVDRLNRLAHGHPLSLRLAASALAARPELSLDQVALPAVVAELTRLYLGGLDPATRRALDAAAVVRRPTRSVMAAMLAEDGEDAWRRLDGLPFAEAGPDGLVLHDTVREAVDAALAAADPQRRRRLRVAAFTQLQSEVREATPTELWRYTSDLLFLADNPLIRDGFFPTGERRSRSRRPPKPTAGRSSRSWSATRAGRPRRSPAHGGRPCRGIPRRARPQRGCCCVLRPVRSPRRGGELGHARPGRLTLARRPAPPAAAGRWARAVPAPSAHSRGGEESPAQAALWLDAKRLYMELRPSLRRTYIAVNRLDTLRRLLEPLGFAELPVQLQSLAAAPTTPWFWTSDPPLSTAGSRGSWQPNSG